MAGYRCLIKMQVRNKINHQIRNFCMCASTYSMLRPGHDAQAYTKRCSCYLSRVFSWLVARVFVGSGQVLGCLWPQT